MTFSSAVLKGGGLVRGRLGLPFDLPQKVEQDLNGAPNQLWPTD